MSEHYDHDAVPKNVHAELEQARAERDQARRAYYAACVALHELKGKPSLAAAGDNATTIPDSIPDPAPVAATPAGGEVSEEWLQEIELRGPMGCKPRATGDEVRVLIAEVRRLQTHLEDSPACTQLPIPWDDCPRIAELELPLPSPIVAPSNSDEYGCIYDASIAVANGSTREHIAKLRARIATLEDKLNTALEAELRCIERITELELKRDDLTDRIKELTATLDPVRDWYNADGIERVDEVGMLHDAIAALQRRVEEQKSIIAGVPEKHEAPAVWEGVNEKAIEERLRAIAKSGCFLQNDITWMLPAANSIAEVRRLREEVARCRGGQQKLESQITHRDASIEELASLQQSTAQMIKDLDTLQAECDAARMREKTQVATVIHIIGGEVEGQPTASINYLQRLRQLVAVEEAAPASRLAEALSERDELQAALEFAQNGIKELTSILDPVRDWYDADGDRVDEVGMLHDAIADLQTDRAHCLELRTRIAELEAALEVAHAEIERLVRGQTLDGFSERHGKLILERDELKRERDEARMDAAAKVEGMGELAALVKLAAKT